MADPLYVPKDERGLVRVFAIDVADNDQAVWRDPEAEGWPLPEALGIEALGAADVQVLKMSEMGGLGLGAFLADGYGIAADQLEKDRDVLTDQSGLVAVVRSAAFSGPVQLQPAPPVRFLALYAEPGIALPHGSVGTYRSAQRREAAIEDPALPHAPATAPDDSFRPDRGRYINAHLWLAAVGMVGAGLALWLLDNPHVWVGPLAAVLAVAVRGFYLASEELGQYWQLGDNGVSAITAEGKQARQVGLGEIERVRRLGHAVQIVTHRGDKMLLKYMADPEAVATRIGRAAGLPQ